VLLPLQKLGKNEGVEMGREIKLTM
jgi:hypothetical protein